MRPQHVRRIPFSRAFNAKLTGLAPVYRIAHPNKLVFSVSLVVLLLAVGGTLVSVYGMQSNSKTASAHISSSTPEAPPDSTVISSSLTRHSNASAATPVTSPHQEVTTHVRSTVQSSTPTTVHVTVNGHTVPVPKNGTSEQTITDTSGKTTVNISSNTTASSDITGSSSATTNVQLHTSTESQNSSMSGP